VQSERSEFDAALRHMAETAPFDAPAPTGWTMAPDLLRYLVEFIRQQRPERIVEIGSGLSSCWIALALKAFDVPGHLISLEHLPDYHQQTCAQLDVYGVRHLAEVRLAPLIETTVEEQVWQWYSSSAWQDLDRCDLLIVDGPPGRTAPLARYPAVPLLESALSSAATVVLDDYNRPDEREIVARWRTRHPTWSLHEPRHVKGTAVLRLPE
jgi:hypothetical protein